MKMEIINIYPTGSKKLYPLLRILFLKILSRYEASAIISNERKNSMGLAGNTAMHPNLSPFILRIKLKIMPFLILKRML
jgi:hypothetical protein